MTQAVLSAIGGVGIFLVGIFALTEGLRSLAGGALRRFIRSATVSPSTGALTGAATTALLQSSSATTVAAVGFVGAGLMSFPQALGVIFGANIGSTATGWLVTLIGFKLQAGDFALPLVFVGIALRLFGRGRLRNIGWAIAGFGLMFVGIATLQDAMAGSRAWFDPASLPDGTLLGRFLLVLIGIAVTLITQASSAGVALSLAAIGAGAIDFTQAAALVIGMDIGTTFTAVLATAGGSVAVRRTGFAHLVYNLLTGAMAFFLLLPLIGWADAALPGGLVRDPQIGLVAFHTTFNVLGVIAILPFTRQFARLMQRLIPERGPALTARLDERLLAEPAAACDALVATVTEIAEALFGIVSTRLAGSRVSASGTELTAIGEAIDETRRFADHIHFGPTENRTAETGPVARHGCALHVLDHVGRLAGRARQHERVDLCASDPRLRPLADRLVRALQAPLTGDDIKKVVAAFDRLHRKFRREHQSFRARTITLASAGEVEVDDALKLLDAARWLDRVSYHLWRILVHLEMIRFGHVALSPAREAAAEIEED